MRRAPVALALMALAWPCEVAGGEVPAEFFGVNAGDLFELPTATREAQLEALAAGGVSVVRLPAVWSNLEPQAPDPDGARHLDWQPIDDAVAALARHGLRWQPVLCFTATWDETTTGDDASRPVGTAPFAQFAAALAQRYGTGGAFWSAHPELAPAPVQAYELWNEPNAAAFWHPQRDAPEAYADLYAAARDAIHRVDAFARVVVGGLASPAHGVLPAQRFVARMVAHRPDLRGGLDAVGYHPYAPTVDGVFRELAGFRRALDASAGPGVPIQLTEVGWTTTDTPEPRRAANMAQLAATLPRSDCGVERLLPYAWIGAEQDPADRLQWFGMSGRGGMPKPSGAAYLRMAGSLERDGGSPDAAALCRPRLQLRLHAVTPRLTVSSSCSAACALSLRVTRAGDRTTLARRALRFRRGRRSVRLLLPPSVGPGTRLALRAHAWTYAGWRATRVRTVRVQHR